MTALLLILVLLYCFHLTRRINSLERKISKSATESEASAQPLDVTASSKLDLTKPAQTSSQNVDSSQPSEAMGGLLQWLATDWLIKLGAFLLILGIGWFVNYAFAENWIGPVGRVTLGLIAGSAVLLFGESWNKRSPLQATIFMVVGVTAILLTTYAARTVYEFFTPLTATFLMAAAVAMMALSSVIHKLENRAIISLAFAALVPFLTASTDASVIGLLSYGFIICIGFLWIVTLTGWRRVSAVALAVYGIYALLSMFSFSPEDIFLLRVLAFSFTLLFYAVGLITHLQVKTPSAADYIVSLGNALIMVLWIQRIEAIHLASVLTSLGALAFFLGAFLLYKATSKKEVILEYTAVALSLVAIAATFELDGPVLSITYSLLVCVGVFLTQAITKQLRHSQAVGFLFLPVIGHSVLQWLDSKSYGSYRTNLSVDTLFTWWVFALELAGLGYYFYRQGKKQQSEDIISSAAVYLIGSLVMALFTVWETIGYIITQSDTAHAVTLVIFTIIGLLLYVYGRLQFRKKTMYSGAGVLGFVIIRLLLVEIWSMDLFQRVIIFSLVGILLMATAFIKPQKKETSG